MERELYCVLDDNGNVIAYHMELRHALLFIQALMLEFYQEVNLTYRIMREQSGTEARDCDER